MMPAALDAATRALEIDPDRLKPTTRSPVRRSLGTGLSSAEHEFLEALALNPKYIQARCWYGLFFLHWTAARHDEGLAQVWQAFEADPLSAYVDDGCVVCSGRRGARRGSPGLCENSGGRGSAIVSGRDGNWPSHITGTGNTTKPSRCWRRSGPSRRTTGSRCRIVPTYAKVGRLDASARHLRGVVGAPRHEYVPPFALAACASGLGDHEAAMAFCVEAVEGRDVLLGLSIRGYPISSRFAPIRASPA